jgi:hypothetical protein
MLFSRAIDYVLLSSICGSAFAQGGYQAALNQPLSDFTASSYPQKVDIIPGVK